MVYNTGITFDEALSKCIGEFGRGQRRVVGLTSAFWLANGFVFLVWVFMSKDPVAGLSWECSDPSDTACNAVWRSSKPAEGFCMLSSIQWHWTSRGESQRKALL
eukprot:GHRR01036405.1.p1 GENE.GHRR01036405.1~~GHRR01036405.1.p1  ORF type:complete len:104 (-),score=11.67 GHRR01036405.1:361-672(-)